MEGKNSTRSGFKAKFEFLTTIPARKICLRSELFRSHPSLEWVHHSLRDNRSQILPYYHHRQSSPVASLLFCSLESCVPRYPILTWIYTTISESRASYVSCVGLECLWLVRRMDRTGSRLRVYARWVEWSARMEEKLKLEASEEKWEVCVILFF